ncbi:Insertion element protein [Pseudonocardiaceae bacterium YIM PH 21723]|nr:Insertion element protein [Pseudonocardiaceae bacterium YIM PH 21723]
MSFSDSGTGQRAVPFYCPYCGDEDLRPHPEPHGAWLCGGCRRVFSVKMAGLSLSDKDLEVSG